MIALKEALSDVPERARVSRSGSQTRARSQVVMVRLSPDERARFAALAARKGWSLPQLMRLAVEAALLEEYVRENPPRRWSV